MLLLDYQNVLIQSLLTERFSGYSLPSPPFSFSQGTSLSLPLFQRAPSIN